MSTGDPSSTGSAGKPLRYAHPFFTSIPPAERRPDFSQFGQRMSEWAQRDLGPIPAPRTETSVLELSDVIGADGVKEIESSGAMKFHAVGDTGRPTGSDPAQEDVANQMAADYSGHAIGESGVLSSPGGPRCLRSPLRLESFERR
jgi:hypothetical protein